MERVTKRFRMLKAKCRVCGCSSEHAAAKALMDMFDLSVTDAERVIGRMTTVYHECAHARAAGRVLVLLCGSRKAAILCSVLVLRRVLLVTHPQTALQAQAEV